MSDQPCRCIRPDRPLPHEGHCCLLKVAGDQLSCHADEWAAAYPRAGA